MDRQRPRTTSDEIDLYIRTYYSLLRSSGEVRVRAFEESHCFSDSSLHSGARSSTPDVAAFAYSAARLPACMPQVRRIVLGQSHESFEAAGHAIRTWERVQTRGRRRPLRFDGGDLLGAFISSTSDIDDIVPIVTAYQIVWNQMHELLLDTELGRRLLAAPVDGPMPAVDFAELGKLLGLDEEGARTVCAALDHDWVRSLRAICEHTCDLSLRVLSGSYSQYQRASQRWWSDIEPHYLRETSPRRPPIYFVSSNTHSLLNLLGGYARTHRDEIIEYARRRDPEGLAKPLMDAIEGGREPEISNLTYYLLRAFLHEDPKQTQARLAEIQAFEAEGGIFIVKSKGSANLNVTVKLKPTAATCTTCHTREAQTPHGQAQACVTCHRAHGPSGVGQIPGCARCHPTKAFASAPRTCAGAGCHKGDDVHEGQLGAACRVVPGGGRGAGHVAADLHTRIGVLGALFVAALELADQRDVHAAHEAHLAGLAGPVSYTHLTLPTSDLV